MNTVDTGTGGMFRAYTGHMLYQDIRFGLRTALKNKGVTGLAVVCPAIGGGLKTMMFSVTHGGLVKPPPHHQPHPLRALFPTHPPPGQPPHHLSLPQPPDRRR